MFPTIPVITIAATVNDGIPANFSDMAMPIGVVIDFGSSAINSGLLNPKARHIPKTSDKLVTTPEIIPSRIASQLSFNFSNCS